jgi:hypothetical protein
MEVGKVLVAVVVETSTCLADHSHRLGSEGVGAKLLEGAGALLPDRMDRAFHVLWNLKLHRIVEGAAILEEYEKLADGLGI